MNILQFIIEGVNNPNCEQKHPMEFAGTEAGRITLLKREIYLILMRKYLFFKACPDTSAS